MIHFFGNGIWIFTIRNGRTENVFPWPSHMNSSLSEFGNLGSDSFLSESWQHNSHLLISTMANKRLKSDPLSFVGSYLFLTVKRRQFSILPGHTDISLRLPPDMDLFSIILFVVLIK